MLMSPMWSMAQVSDGLHVPTRSEVGPQAMPQTVARVVINGHEAGTVWCSPWAIDVTRYLKKGKNTLEIQVANCLWNRLVGDANKPEAARIMQQNYPLAKPQDQLTPSGLTGRVRLIIETE